MKYIKIRYIIGTLAIIAIVVMNFTYAHNNYGIPKMNGITKANATTAAPTYREVLEIEYENCPVYTYDVIVHAKKTPDEIFWDIEHGGYIGPYWGEHRVPFYSKSMQKAYEAAKKYAQDVNESNPELDFAEVDMSCYISLAHTEAHRVNCLQSGNLMYCETKDAECDPLEYESSLER